MLCLFSWNHKCLFFWGQWPLTTRNTSLWRVRTKKDWSGFTSLEWLTLIWLQVAVRLKSNSVSNISLPLKFRLEMESNIYPTTIRCACHHVFNCGYVIPFPILPWFQMVSKWWNLDQKWLHAVTLVPCLASHMSMKLLSLSLLFITTK